MGFHRRFVLAVVAVTALALGGGSGVVYVVVTRTERAQFDAAILASARATALAIDPRVGQQTIPVRPRGGGSGTGYVAPLAPVIAIYGPEGPPVAPWDPPVPVPDRSFVRDRDAEPFSILLGTTKTRAVVLAFPRHPGYRLFYAAPTEELELEHAFLREAMATGFTLALVWTTLVSAFVVRRFTRGIESISGVVRKVASGDLKARVPVLRGDPLVMRLARDIDEMTSRLDLLVRSKQDFIGHAAHELRTPLASLYGELSLALRRPRSTEEYRRAIEEALDASRRLRDLAEDLLALARLGEGAGPATLVEVDDAVDDARAVVRGAAREHGVSLRIYGTGGSVRGHRGDLARVLRNLLENAIRHSPRGEAVMVSLSHDDTSQLVRVSDAGTGIPAEEVAHIFEPFFRGAEVRAMDGSGAGLGLAIARGIAIEHGGDLLLVPSERGACFELRLPRALAAED